MTDRGGELWDAGYYCAESVLLVVAEAYGIESDVIPGIATGFCGGLSDSCGLCGAVSGAIMGIGLVKGRSGPDESVEDAYATVRQLLSRFVAGFGATNCADLTGCDLGTPEGQESFRLRDQGQQCREYVIEATRMALELTKA